MRQVEAGCPCGCGVGSKPGGTPPGRRQVSKARGAPGATTGWGQSKGVGVLPTAGDQTAPGDGSLTGPGSPAGTACGRLVRGAELGRHVSRGRVQPMAHAHGADAASPEPWTQPLAVQHADFVDGRAWFGHPLSPPAAGKMAPSLESPTLRGEG